MAPSPTTISDAASPKLNASTRVTRKPRVALGSRPASRSGRWAREGSPRRTRGRRSPSGKGDPPGAAHEDGHESRDRDPRVRAIVPGRRVIRVRPCSPTTPKQAAPRSRQQRHRRRPPATDRRPPAGTPRSRARTAQSQRDHREAMHQGDGGAGDDGLARPGSGTNHGGRHQGLPMTRQERVPCAEGERDHRPEQNEPDALVCDTAANGPPPGDRRRLACHMVGTERPARASPDGTRPHRGHRERARQQVVGVGPQHVAHARGRHRGPVSTIATPSALVAVISRQPSRPGSLRSSNVSSPEASADMGRGTSPPGGRVERPP